MGRLGRWFDDRLQLGEPLVATLTHPVPRETASWAYVFGSAALTVFGLQVVTGILLAILYVPSAGGAFDRLRMPNHQGAMAWFIPAPPPWASNSLLTTVPLPKAQA